MKELVKTITEADMRDFFLAFNCRGLELQNLAQEPGTTSSGWRGTIEIFE